MTSGMRQAVLDQFGATDRDRIGAGGESIVYALGADRILRVPRAGTFNVAELERQRRLLAEIEGRLPFATPVVEEIDPGGRYTIERRLAGRPMDEVLAPLSPGLRRDGFRNYLAAAEA